MSGMKIRHDFAAGEEIISGTSQHQQNLTSAKDESESLHKTSQAVLGTDVAGSEEIATIAKLQFQRDTTSIDAANRMYQANQQSQEIQQGAAQQATKYFGNN